MAELNQRLVPKAILTSMNCFPKVPIELCCIQSAYLLDEVIKSYGLVTKSRHLESLIKEEVDLERLLISIILSRDGLALQAFADAFTVVACIGRPSMQSYQRRSQMTEREMLHCIYELLKDLCLFFDRPAPKQIKELIWQLYKAYMDFSLEDMVKFFDCCKKKKFATPYQHISSKGITTDFLLDWITKYQKNRIEAYQNFIKIHKEISHPLLIEYHAIPTIKESEFKLGQQSILKLSDYQQQLWQYLIYQLIYQPEFWDLNQEEMFKKAGIHLAKNATDRNWIVFLKALKIRFDANPTTKLVKRKIDKLILKERIQTGEELCSRLLPESLPRGCYLFSKEIATKDIINYKLSAIQRAYWPYFHQKMSCGEIPLEEVFYVKLEAWKWICKIAST